MAGSKQTEEGGISQHVRLVGQFFATAVVVSKSWHVFNMRISLWKEKFYVCIKIHCSQVICSCKLLKAEIVLQRAACIGSLFLYSVFFLSVWQIQWAGWTIVLMLYVCAYILDRVVACCIYYQSDGYVIVVLL